MSFAPGSDLHACAGIVERGDPVRFRAVMAAPPAARERLFPLYAFNVEIARAPWLTQEPMIAEMRLQWWRDVLEEIAAGGAVRRHEVATPLAAVLRPAQARRLFGAIEARRWDIYSDPFEDAAEFQTHLSLTSGELLLAAAQSLGPADEEVVLAAGAAQGLANWFCAIPALEAAGRIPLPDGRPETVAALAAEALARLRLARQRRDAVSAAARPAMLAVWQSGAILSRVARDPGAVAAGALDLSPMADHGGLIWRALSGRW